MVFFIVILSVFLFGCTSENHVTTELKPFSEKGLFGKNYKAYDAISKREAVISVIEIPKENFSESEIQALKQGLLDRGWVLKGENQGFYSYCKGRYKHINLAIVNSHFMFDYQFKQYEFENLENIILNCSFYKFGIDKCM